jgi:molybdopterin-containing oxidoreductase family iron-sulfur binding subunit
MSAAGGLSDLAEDIRASQVETLVIIESNPVATAPGDLDFETLIARVPFRIHLGGYYDETAAASTWHLPAPHPLESWSDIAATDGVVSIVQPLIRPLHERRERPPASGRACRESATERHRPHPRDLAIALGGGKF